MDRILEEVLGTTKLRDAQVRLCIPSLDWKYGDVYVFKTPHHPDYKKDGDEAMAKVAAATAAASTYVRPVEDGYTFADGGVWANNPVMVGLVEALSSFTTERNDFSILSIGCGEDPYTISRIQRWLGGKARMDKYHICSYAFPINERFGASRPADRRRQNYPALPPVWWED